MDGDAINAKFTKIFNEIATAFNDCAEDDHITLNQCIARTRVLLRESTIPRYHRIKFYLQLANMVGGYEQANEYHRRATSLLRVNRSHEVKGQTTAQIDATLDELEASVERMREILEREGEEIRGEPEQYDSADGESDVRGKAAKAAETLEEEASAKREEEETELENAAILGFPTNEDGVDLMNRVMPLLANPKEGQGRVPSEEKALGRMAAD